mmetsp:Transcript_1868/g.4320  ORF Transcript_1868/g.4320 Transcript_1868/m.4320 type:complete len:203 (+) Transcript_1868:1056-1664(+)
MRDGRIEMVHHCHRGRPHSQVERLFVNVEPDVRLEHSHHDELGTQVSVRLLEVTLVIILMFDTFDDEVTDQKLLHHLLTPRCVEGGEDVGGVVTGMGKDDGTTGVFMPVGNVVDLVMVHDPSIARGVVLLDFRPCELLQCLLRRCLTGQLCFSSFSHCSIRLSQLLGGFYSEERIIKPRRSVAGVAGGYKQTGLLCCNNNEL